MTSKPLFTILLTFCLSWASATYANAPTDLVSMVNAYKAFIQQGKTKAALSLARKAYAMAEKDLSPTDTSYQIITHDLGRLLLKANKNQQAISLLTPLLEQQEQQFGKFDKNLIPTLKTLTEASRSIKSKLYKTYSTRYQKLALRHYSDEYVKGFEKQPLKSTQQAKNLAKKLRKITGKNYQVTDAGKWDLIYNHNSDKDFAPIIEQMQLSHRSSLGFLLAFGVASKPAKEKFKAVYFNDRDDYKAYLNSFKSVERSESAERSAGMYLRPPINSLILFNRLNGSESQNAKLAKEKRTLQTLRHEIAHQLFFNFGLHAKGVRYPRWLTEGLAETMEFEDQSVISGPQTTNINLTVLTRLQKKHSSIGLSPLRRIVSMSAKTEYDRENTRDVYDMGSVVARFLYQHHPDKFLEYIVSFSKGRTVESAKRRAQFYRYLGDEEQLQTEFDAYLAELFTLL